MNISEELRSQVNDVFDKFEEFKKECEAFPYGNNQKIFFGIMERFQMFLASFENEELIKMVMHSERYTPYEKFFQHQNDYFMRSIETVEALDIINSKIGVESSLLDLISADYLRDRYLQKTKDFQLADFENVQKIVMVGCGPFPDTVLYLHENTDVPEIIGLDNNQEAIHISSQFISNLGFNRIKLICIDGCSYDYSDADLVYIAGFVRPKHEILKQIAETSKKKDIQIIADSIRGMQNLLFESVNDSNVHPRLKIEEKDYCPSKFCKWEILKIKKYDI